MWICTYNDFHGLVLVLRDSLLKVADAYSSQTNMGDICRAPASPPGVVHAIPVA